ncbi:hypothetical protein SAMN06893096_103168 [Geodermatophilus pulveris]|uniref:Uncharacterized protein n=1 Tax=Geodermatophilus pulveris TaxID=1564159 RepID=A0A239DG17_9ACTN|nr:hypothetical protein SAMN06893096_103168 [Geodermatophilus pulveris]
MGWTLSEQSEPAQAVVDQNSNAARPGEPSQ